jgi:hypothetical protein
MNNVECWLATIYIVECENCGDYEVSEDRATAVSPTHCPSCERTDRTSVKATDKQAWFYWYCLPGCLPDSDESGPFDTEQAALDDAEEWS